MNSILIYMTFLLFPLQWISVPGVAFIDLPQVGFLIGIVAWSPVRFSTKGVTKFSFRPYQLAFLLFLCLLIGLYSSEDFTEGLKVVLRSAIYLIGGAATYFWLASLKRDQLLTALARAIPISIFMFFIIFFLSAWLRDVNVIEEIIFALQKGDPYQLQYRVFVKVFNESTVGLQISELGYSSATRHGIVIVLISYVLMLVGLRVNNKKNIGLLPLTLSIMPVLIFTLLTLSRTGILFGILALSSFLVFLLWRRKLPKFVLILIPAIMLAPMFLSINENGALGEILSEKFIDDVADNPRVREYIQIFDIIDKKPLLGFGTGTSLNLVGLEAQYPHNLIVYMWHQVGVLGLCVGGLVFFYYVYFCLKLYCMALKEPRKNVYCYFLIASMLMWGPIVRMTFAKAGLLASSEWCCIMLATLSYLLAKRELTENA